MAKGIIRRESQTNLVSSYELIALVSVGSAEWGRDTHKVVSPPCVDVAWFYDLLPILLALRARAEG